MATRARKVYSGNDVRHAYTYMRYQRVQHFASARIYMRICVCVYVIIREAFILEPEDIF